MQQRHKPYDYHESQRKRFPRFPTVAMAVKIDRALQIVKRSMGFLSKSLIIDLLAILQKSLDRALFLYNFIRKVRSSGVRGSITTR